MISHRLRIVWSLILIVALIATRSVESITPSQFSEVCVQELARYEDGTLTVTKYPKLLSVLSGDRVKEVIPFKKLPLLLISMFNFNACANGRPCAKSETSNASIPTHSEDVRQMACTTIQSALEASNLLPKFAPTCNETMGEICNSPPISDCERHDVCVR